MKRSSFPSPRELSEVIKGIPDRPGQYVCIGITPQGRFSVLSVGNNYYHADAGGQLGIQGIECAEGGPFDLVLPGGVGLLGPDAARNWTVVGAIYESYLRRVDAFLKGLPDKRWWFGWLEARTRLSS